MTASAFAEIHYHTVDDSTDADEEGDSPLFKDCTLDPFTLNWRSDPEKLNDRFNKWLEEGLVVAMRYWYEFLEI